ncbi:MAG: transporter related [Enterovirga sp.]|nr:transporter related [Enterovirga sp.]
MSAPPPALLVRELGHRFGNRAALADVSVSVPEGGFVALLGPNGAGKTTLFSVATGLYANQSGSVSVFGHDIRSAASAALARLGVVFQARTLDADLTVRQNLVYHAALHGIRGRAAMPRIIELLDRVGLRERLDEKVRTLSGGQARRIEIARALVHGPRLLLLDEPTVGLDLASRSDVVRIVRDLVAAERLSVLWATHIFDEVDPGDQVVVLHAGKVVATGVASDLARPGGSLEASFRQLTASPRRAA